MRIDNLAAALPLQAQSLSKNNAAGQGPAGTLLDQLSKDFGAMIDEVNQLHLEADDKIEEFATSPNKDIHGTLIAMEKAGLSMRLMLQVRSKLTSAFQEIMRTPI